MKTGVPRHLRRSLSVAAAGILAVALTACSGHGGGKLPPDGPVFTGPATFGFSFSCERSARSLNLHPKPGRMRVQLNYHDHGSNPLGSSFGIHGIVEEMDPITESMICIADNPPPEPGHANVLTFTGRYWLAGPAPEGFPAECPVRETDTAPLCRFEVTVWDNDVDGSVGIGDSFRIRLSTQTVPLVELDFPAPEVPEVFYTREGELSSGHITVD
jgi:hypothetical protein